MSHGTAAPELDVFMAGFLPCLCLSMAVAALWGQIMGQEEELSIPGSGRLLPLVTSPHPQVENSACLRPCACSVAVTKHSVVLGVSEQQAHAASQFWRSQVWNQGVACCGRWLGPSGLSLCLTQQLSPCLFPSWKDSGPGFRA